MSFRKLISLTLALALVLGVMTFAAADETAPVRIASMKGPTSMGLVKLMNANENGEAAQTYEFTLSGTANEIVPLLTRGELDIAMVPCNLASVLYNNTKGQVKVMAVNTLGVLYVLESGDSIQSVADLGIVAKAPLAQKALPACNIVYIDGEEMKTAVSGYLSVLYEQSPEAVGGALPDEAFYYIP